MEKGDSLKRRRIIGAKNSMDDNVVPSNGPFYFDTLSEEVLSTVITRLSTNPGNKWHKYEVFECAGVFGDLLRCSFTEETLVLSKYSIDVASDGQLFKKGTTYAHLYNQIFILESPNVFDSCHYLRSLQIHFKFDYDFDVPSLDVLFATCGNVLEKLELSYYGQASLKLLSLSIIRHCRALNRLSLKGDNRGLLYLPLFRIIGAGLRHLYLAREPPKGIWQHCLRLENLSLCSGKDLSFVADIKSSLRVITFHDAHPASELSELVRIIPDVSIHLMYAISMEFDEFNNLVRICDKHLRTLECISDTEVPSDFGNICSSLTNLQAFGLWTESDSLSFLDSFFMTPKPNLRKLHIWEELLPDVFDILATKVCTLETLECSVKVSEYPMKGTELTKLLSTNSNLHYLSIYYRERADWSTPAMNKWYGSLTRNTVLLIRSLKIYTSLGKFKIHTPRIGKKGEGFSEEIADACVAFRGRGLDIEVDGKQFLEYS